MKIAYTKSAKGLSRNNCVTLWGRALACGRLQSASLKGPRRPQRPTEVAPQVETCPTSPQQRVHDWNGYFMTMPKDYVSHLKDGRAELVVQDAERYQVLLDRLARAEVASIRRPRERLSNNP